MIKLLQDPNRIELKVGLALIRACGDDRIPDAKLWQHVDWVESNARRLIKKEHADTAKEVKSRRERASLVESLRAAL